MLIVFSNIKDTTKVNHGTWKYLYCRLRTVLFARINVILMQSTITER